MVINIMTPVLVMFGLNLKIFSNFWKIFCMLQVCGSLWASESFSGLKQGYWIVSWDNEMVLKILIYWIVARLTFAIVFKIFLCFHFPSLTTNTGQRNFLRLGDGLFDRTSGTKNRFWAFYAAKSKHLLSFDFFSFFNNGRNLEIAESNTIMKNICSSLSVPSFFFSFTFYFSVTLSLSVSLCRSLSLSLSLSLFVCAALQLLLCCVILSSIILINAEL